MHVAQERESERIALVELRVGERRVPTDAEHHRARGLELRGDPAEVAQLGRSDVAPVVAIEEEDHIGHALELGEGDVAPARGGQREEGSILTVAQHGLLIPGGLELHGHYLVAGEVALDHARLLLELVRDAHRVLPDAGRKLLWCSASSAGFARAICYGGRFGRGINPALASRRPAGRRSSRNAAPSETPIATRPPTRCADSCSP